MLVKDCKSKLKVGDKVRTNATGGSSIVVGPDIEGEVGEITGHNFYIFQNERDGDVGSVRPGSRGYKFSWHVSFSNSCAVIEILKPAKGKMRKVGAMLKRLLSKDDRLLYEMEYFNSDLELTEKGRKALDAIVFDVYRKELVTLAKEEKEEEKGK